MNSPNENAQPSPAAIRAAMDASSKFDLSVIQYKQLVEFIDREFAPVREQRDKALEACEAVVISCVHMPECKKVKNKKAKCTCYMRLCHAALATLEKGENDGK